MFFLRRLKPSAQKAPDDVGTSPLSPEAATATGNRSEKRVNSSTSRGTGSGTPLQASKRRRIGSPSQEPPRFVVPDAAQDSSLSTTTTTSVPKPSFALPNRDDYSLLISSLTSPNPANCPGFRTVLATFRGLLNDSDSADQAARPPADKLASILEEHFTPHERDLLTPCTGRRAKQNPWLASMQRDITRFYAEFFRKERFAAAFSEEDKEDVAFRLALAWIGLSVPPLRFGEGAAGGVEDLAGFEVDYLEEGEGSGEEEAGGLGEDGEKGRLRWLDAYKKGGTHESELVRVSSPKLWPYQTGAHPRTERAEASLALRGGAVGEDISPEEAPDVRPIWGRNNRVMFPCKVFEELHNTYSPDPRLPGRWSSSPQLLLLLETRLSATIPTAIEKRWLPLYGYQGIVWFRLDNFYTFVDAVDRLLCLDNRAGVTYSVYLLDKRTDYASQAERDRFLQDRENNGLTMWCAGVGDYSHDYLVWMWIVGKLNPLAANEDEAVAYEKVLFVAGPDDPIPWVWEPDDRHRVMKVVLDLVGGPKLQRPDVAYLRMPENPRDVAYTNQYGDWMRHICRVLVPGKIPGRPGYLAIPDAWFSIRESLGGQAAKNISTYGGLCFLPQLWELILDKWEKGRSQHLQLSATTAPEFGTGASGIRISDRWHLFLPGLARPYEKQYILHQEVDNVQYVGDAIMSLIKESMSQETFSKLKSLEVYMPGSLFFRSDDFDEPLVVKMTAKDLAAQFSPVANRLAQWESWLKTKLGVRPAADGLSMFPQFITIRPVFKDYTIRGSDTGAKAVIWDPASTSITEFRRLVAEIWPRGIWKTPYTERSWIAITQSRPRKGAGKPAHVTHPEENKPKLLIGPDMEEDEWRLLCRMVVEPEVFIWTVDEQNLPRFGDLDTQQPFGYREIYKTPSSSLYRALEQEEIPAMTRYYDYQLWAEDVCSKLKTIQPGDKQPRPLSESFESADYPLQPPGVSLNTRGFPYVRTKRDAGGLNRASAGRLSPGRPDHHTSLVTNVEREQRLRTQSYVQPDYQIVRSIPARAPPVDMLLNLGYESLPIVSLSVLTPTEVRRMQRDYRNMRDLLLSRIERCPYEGCHAVYPADQKWMMQQHLRASHIVENCNLCDETLFQHWPPQQRYQHFVKEHADILKLLGTQPEDRQVQSLSETRVDYNREGRWKFCARCGRDHATLNVQADRTHHDSVCYPGVQDREDDWSACEICGEHISSALGLNGHKNHVCGDIPSDAPFCEKCSLPLGQFSEAYQERHAIFCRDHGRDDAKYCPWCGVELDRRLDLRMDHVENCIQKPNDEAEGPIDTRSKSYFRSAISGESAAETERPKKTRWGFGKPKSVSRPKPLPTTAKAAATKKAPKKAATSRKKSVASKDPSYKPPAELPTRRSERIRKRARPPSITVSVSPPLFSPHSAPLSALAITPSTPNWARRRDSRTTGAASGSESPVPELVPVQTSSGKRFAVPDDSDDDYDEVVHTAKAARVVKQVKYAEPLVRGSSPPKKVGRLVSAFKKGARFGG